MTTHSELSNHCLAESNYSHYLLKDRRPHHECLQKCSPMNRSLIPAHSCTTNQNNLPVSSCYHYLLKDRRLLHRFLQKFSPMSLSLKTTHPCPSNHYLPESN